MASVSLDGSNSQNNNGYNSLNDILDGVASSSDRNDSSNENSFSDNSFNENSSNEENNANAVMEEEGVGEDDEIDEIPVIEGSAASGVQVVSSDNLNPDLHRNDDPALSIQLGDQVIIDSQMYKRTEGVVYYNGPDAMSVKPVGVENMVRIFDMTEDGFDEKYGVRDVHIIEKRKYDSFVEQQDLRVQQIVDTFDKNGEPYKQYRIVKVDEEADSIILQDLGTEEEEEIAFEYMGIPLDAPFQVMSVRQYQAEEKKEDDANVENGEISVEKEVELEAFSGDGEYELEDVQEEVAVLPEDVEGEAVGVNGYAENEEDELEEVGFVEVTQQRIIREAVSSEQRFTDNVQKVDALNDFLASLDPALQKDPKAVRAVRTQVDTLFGLKQATVEYNDDGTVRGQKVVSATYLADLIRQVSIPLGRPVLHVTKKEYSIGTEAEQLEEEKVEESSETEGAVEFVSFTNELKRMVNSGAELVSSKVKGSAADTGQVVELWQNMRKYLHTYLTPWKPNGEAEPLWKAIQDSELFRMAAPDTTEDEKGNEEFINHVPGYLASHSQKAPPIFDRVPFGLERALATTYRKGVDRRKQLFLSQETATMNNYLLFPMKVVDQLGATRSNSIALDSGRAQLTRKTMKTILQELGAPKEVGTANDILLLGVNDSTLGNIPLADYIDGISVPAMGLGDVFQTLEQYGMDNLELTPDIVNVLVKKIEKYQEQLISSLSQLRDILGKEVPKEPEDNPFLENPSILDVITSEPLLVSDLEAFKRINPTLANSDIAQVVYLLQKHPDYFQVAAGKDRVLVAKALWSANRMLYLESLKIATALKRNEQNKGEKPIRNPCKHVADLVAVRRIYDDNERFQKLVELFRHYQGERKENWIECNLCKEHLLCVHERLQIQAYLNPKEKVTIEKEIALKFSGGQFQGQYICRNCGQGFRELDFDNNIEFDDDGRPKSGRAVLVDEDALFQEKLEAAITAPVEPTIQEELELPENGKEIYDIIRDISGSLGINIDKKGFEFITNHVLAYIASLTTPEKYARILAKNPQLASYQQFRAIRIIAMTAAYVLLDIQTHTPPYVIYKTLMGCHSPGFDGYPLDTDASKKQGIEYVACAISSMRERKGIWNDTGYNQVKGDTERLKIIIADIERALKDPLSNVNVATKLEKARIYLAETMGTQSQKGRPRDMIPATFLPQQVIVSPEEAAKNVITPEVAAAMGQKGAMALVKLWIRQAHAIAKPTAALIRGSPLADTTCCLAPVNQPGMFWYRQAELPPIGKRTLTPLMQGQPMLTHFAPRAASSVVAEPNKDQYYLIFLKCCFTGPRTGYPHEPGLDNLCPWCGFQFPNMPSVMDAATEGKAQLVSQNIEINNNTFTNLLDTIHNVNRVQPIPRKPIITDADVIAEFADIQPPPVPAWNTILMETYQNFSGLENDADDGSIALAAGPISDVARVVRDAVKSRFKQKHQDILDKMVRLPWLNFFQVLQSYFLTPFERKVVDFKTDSLAIPYELQKTLVDDDVNDLNKMLAVDFEVVTFKQAELKNNNYRVALEKMNFFVQQLRVILPFKNQIGPKTIKHGKRALEYIQEVLLYGPLSTLLDIRQLPPGIESRKLKDDSKALLFEYVGGTLIKYNKEYLSYDDKEIKEQIQIRNEKEQTMVLDRLNKLSEEERRVELQLKNLRMGKWAIGKKISSYNEEVQRIERQQRVDMGLETDESQPSAFAEIDEYDGPHMDEDGNMVFTEEYYERDGAYDTRQRPDEDDE